MPEEVITNPVPEVVTTESNAAPNLDKELDDALSKSFRNIIPEKNETKKEEPKVEKATEQKELSTEESKPSKEVKIDDKPLEQDSKPLPPPESIEDSPQGKGQSAWNALKNNYKRSFKTIEQKDQEITKLKSSLADKSNLSQKETETLKTQIEELSRYRAMVDIQADPEFIVKFDGPIKEKIDSMKELLKGWNVGESIINSIDFLDKNKVGIIAKSLRQNENLINSEFELEEFMSNAKEVLELSKKRDKELKSHSENYKETLENKKKEAFSKGAEEEGRMIKHLENIAVGKDREGNQKYNAIPFLNKMTPKDGANQLEVDQINNHNKMVDLISQKIKSAMKVNTPEDKAEMIVAAIGSQYLQAQVKMLTSENNSLKEQIKKISAVGTETEKTKNVPVSRNGNGHMIKADEALDNYFAKR